MPRNRFVLNEHLDVVLEDDGTTRIYIDGEPFTLCKHLIMTLPVDALGDSIDEIVERAPQSALTEMNRLESPASAEEIFWGHCSNLQAWVEHDYDTRLLDSRLSFPLLKVLAKVGDGKARRVFDAEITSRFEQGNKYTILAIIDSIGKDIDLIDPDTILRMLPKDRETRLYLARMHGTPGYVFDVLVNDQDPEIDMAIARNENASDHALEILASNENKEICKWVASNISANIETLELLAREPNLRYFVALNQRTPEYLLEQFMADPVRVLYGIAKNWSSPPQLLARIAANPKRELRDEVARNFGASADLLDTLAYDDYDNVRASVAFNPNTSADTLARSEIFRLGHCLCPCPERKKGHFFCSFW
jgi:hypothetical protein